MKKTFRRMPAEWEPQRMIQLTWPHRDTDWAPMLPQITATYEAMAREILKRESLLIVAPAGVQLPESVIATPHSLGENCQLSTINCQLSTVNCQLSTVNCKLSTINSNDTWARDHGFITVVESSSLSPHPSAISHHPSAISHHSSPILLDFQFNGWGRKFPAQLDNQINRQLYDAGLVRGTYEDHLDFVLEGGSIESDGRGTIFTTACCLMAPNRNQPLTRQQIDERLRQWLGAERVVWIEHGSLIGDDTDGHIDTLVRICPDDTILYTAADGDHPDLLLMEQELQELRTLDGRPYRLLRLPLPRPILDDGDRLPATYANYLVLNGAVLVPTYDQPDLDAQALSTVRQAYPDRDIVPVDCRAVIRQHGSLHCCTMQYY